MKARTFLLSGLALSLSASAVQAQSAADCIGGDKGVRLTVEVTGVRAAAGEMAVTIYPDVRRRFLAPRGKLLRARVRARAPISQACFNLPAAGVYAIAIYHDANANQDFDRSRLGVPTEGFGFSNDAPTNFALPSFSAVRFSVRRGQNTIRIRTRYPDDERARR